MGLKGILFGTAAAVVSVATVNAADLPVRKAAPVEYVRVCDAYGRGFFYIPGTETCIRIGGRVRADYAIVPAKDIYVSIDSAGRGTFQRGGSTFGIPAESQHAWGWHARARISADVRTRTSWGTVQAVMSLRMARSTGVLEAVAEDTGGGGGADSTLEAAYIRFAGFTFGAARDNFAMMPSLTYGAGHWGSFANGAKQIAYTHNFGGGLSGTIALQDWQDTNNPIGRAPAIFNGVTSTLPGDGNTYYVYKSAPQVNARLDWTQGWGELTLAGAFANVPIVTNEVCNTVALDDFGDPGPGNVNYCNPAGYPAVGRATYDKDVNVWAIGGKVKINLPMLAQGDAIWFHGAYADGMTEYTINWASRKTSAYQRDVSGFVNTAPSIIATPTGIDTVKSWNVAAIMQHFWAPQWRSVLWGSYGQLDAPLLASRCGWTGSGCIGDTTAWNIGTNFAWLPTRDFEIGVEVIYARVSQDVRYNDVWDASTTVFRKNDSNVTGRLRIERNF